MKRRAKEIKIDPLLLEAIPERTVEWEKDSESKLAVLLVPKFRKGPLKKWLQPRIKRPFYRVKLDDVGTCVWENCDGKNTVRQIGSILESQFGEKVKPIEQRITLFFTQLYKGRFVKYWQSSSVFGE